jgi:hypothetical protein
LIKEDHDMNGAFLHLAVNHIPVVAVPFTAILMLVGLIRRSRDLIHVSYAAILVCAIFALISLKSGGPAARTLFQSGAPGIARESIHNHAEAAEGAMIGVGIATVLGLLGFGLSFRTTGSPLWLNVIAMLWFFALSVAFMRVAHLGGLIRHPEIAAPPAKL